MPPSNATNATHQAGNYTGATPAAIFGNDSKTTTPFPFVYGPIGVHKKKPGVVGAGSTGQMVGIDSGGTLGIVMAVAVVIGIFLMFFLWKKAGEELDDQEAGLLDETPSGSGGAVAAADVETQPGEGSAQETSLTEEPPDPDTTTET